MSLAANEEVVFFGPRKVAVWPEGQVIEPKCGGKVLMTRFRDIDLYHDDLTQQILERESSSEDARRFFKAAGTSKVYHLEKWRRPAADLIHARALALYRRALGRVRAQADLSWANVYRDGDFSMAHSHVRSTASIVYAVRSGDEDPEDPLNGQFCLIDPRVEACCREQRGHMTSPFMPKMAPGTMIIFAANLVHCVNPYRGRSPRITVAWNVNDDALPGSPLPDE